MASRGITGQSVSSSAHRMALFGGFDDHFMKIDLLTGRASSVPSSGRTVIHPWDASHFLCIEEVLGRPSKTRLTLRPVGEPGEVVAADGEWADEARFVPGLFPTMYELSAGNVVAREVTVTSGDATMTFATGVYNSTVPVLADGAWTAPDGTVIPGFGAGAGDLLFLAGPDGLVVAREGRIANTAAPSPWRPAAIEHDPVRGRVLVASWNRWGALGGPSTDIYIYDEAGELLATGRAEALIERMALDEAGAVVLDVETKPHSVELSAASG